MRSRESICDWNFEVGPNGVIQEGEHEPLCFRVPPQTAFGFKKATPSAKLAGGSRAPNVK